MNKLRSQHGFTLVELIIALALSSVLMLVMSAGVVRLYNIYQAGNEIRTTQQGARSIVEEISRGARASLAMAASSNGLCIATSVKQQGVSGGQPTYNTKVYYKANVNGVDNLYRTDGTMVGTACAVPGGASGEQISPANTSVVAFTPVVTQPTTPGLKPRLMSMDLSLAPAAALDLVDTSGAIPTCRIQTGSQYCSVTSVRTSVASQQESGK